MKSFPELSILSGQYKGIKLKSPGGATHPMGSREKNATLNMLAPYLEGARVIDYFAGSGALGLEALSRGAASVTFVENDPKAIKVIEENIARCERGAVARCEMGGFSNNKEIFPREMTTLAGSFDPWDSRGPKARGPKLERSGISARVRPSVVISNGRKISRSRNPSFAPCDLIISDPPYDDYQVPDYASLLRPGGILALSHPGNFDPASITGLTFIKTHHYAACHISLFTK